MIRISYRYKKWDFFDNGYKQKVIIVRDLEELRRKIQKIYEKNSYSYIEIIEEVKK